MADETDPDPDTEALAEAVVAELDTGTVVDDKIVVSRRGLTALMGAGLGAGALSMLGVDKATAQTAAGQVGTQQDRVDVFAGEVDANSVKTVEGKITGETKIRANRNSVSPSTTSGDFVELPTTEAIDNRDELDGDQHFTPDKSGWYLIRLHADFQGSSITQGDHVGFRVYNITDSQTVDQKETESIGGEFFDAGTTYIVNLTAGDEYRFEVTNNDNDFKVGDLSTWVKTFWYPVQ